MFRRIGEIKFPINPIPTKGGHFGPGRPKAVSHFHSFMTRVTKIHDFVHFSIPLVPVKPFLKKRNMKFQKIGKRKFIVLTPKGPPFGKKSVIKGDFFWYLWTDKNQNIYLKVHF